MDAYTNRKKLNMDPAKKEILVAALSETRATLPEDMNRIYEWVIDKAEHMPGNQDRIMLMAAECEITVHALERYEKAHGASQESRSMILQLTHTRKEYQALCALA